MTVGGEPRNETTRPVWIGETLVIYLRDIVGLMGPEFFRDRVKAEIIDAWEEAPADAVDVAARVIYRETWGEEPDEAADLLLARITARAVLSALGYPGCPSQETPT